MDRKYEQYSDGKVVEVKSRRTSPNYVRAGEQGEMRVEKRKKGKGIPGCFLKQRSCDSLGP